MGRCRYGRFGYKPWDAIHTVIPRPGDWVETACVALAIAGATVTVPPVIPVGTLNWICGAPALPEICTLAGSDAAGLGNVVV